MAENEFFGSRINSAEIEFCVANYIRDRVERANDMLQRVLNVLEEQAEIFAVRGREDLRMNLGPFSDEGNPEGVVKPVADAIGRYLATQSPSAERIAVCNRKLVDAGVADELRIVLGLIGEDFLLPRDDGGAVGGDQAGASMPVGAQVGVAAPSTEPRRSPTPLPEEGDGEAGAPRRTAPGKAQATAGRHAARPVAVDASDEFYGVPVPAHEHEKARAIVEDARMRAAESLGIRESQYLGGRGLNSWQPKLLKAAFARATADRAAVAERKEPEVAVATEAPVRSEEDADGQIEVAAPQEEVVVREAAVSVHEEPAAEPVAAAEEISTPPTEVAGESAPEIMAEPVDDFFDEGDEEEMDMSSEQDDDMSAEPIDEDPDEAPVLTEPLRPLPRPPTTYFGPPDPVTRGSPPPVRAPTGAGLMSSNVRAGLPPVRDRR